MTRLLPLPPLSVGLIVVVMLTRATLTAAQCPTTTITNSDCITSLTQPGSCTFVVEIYEDCPLGAQLFTIEGTSVTITDCEMFGVNGATVVLNKELDVETEHEYSCNGAITVDGTAYSAVCTVLDINEFSPTLVNQSPAVTLYQEENNDPGYELLEVIVADDDYGETATLVPQLRTTVENTFAIEQKGNCDDATCNQTTYGLNILTSLDYESGVFYEINIDFTSTDARGSSSSTAFKVLLFLNDTSDSPPFWLRIVPSASFEESDSAIVNIFSVEARDRDTAVNHAICYRIESGNDEGYFAIDEKTGQVGCPNGVDREALSTTDFLLGLIAVEVLDGDCATDAGLPNNVTQVTSLNVLDVNDNIPTFDVSALPFTMSELTTTSGDQLTSAAFTVTDLDEGAAGTYSLTSDDPAHLGFDATSGSGVTNFFIKAIYVGDDNVFDFEKMTGDNYDLTFVVTATEEADPTHTTTMTVTVTLEDVNDLSPAFEQDMYNLSVAENTPQGTAVLTVGATDGDTSPEFGTPSIRYFLSQCEEYFAIDTETGSITVVTDTALDYENVEEIDCLLEARDKTGRSPYLSGTATLLVVLEDVDDTTPVLRVEGATVSEEAEVGTAVTGVSARDPDTKAQVSFSIQYEDGTADLIKTWFTITDRDCEVGDFGDNFCAALVVAAPLDREVEDEVRLTIVATDDNTEANAAFDSSPIIITLEDVNDVAPTFCADYTEGLSVYENDAAGTVIATICAQDPDLEDQGNLIFNLSGSDQVTIDPESGVLSVLYPLDREEEPTVTVTITVTDTVRHYDSVEATIAVTDRNDNNPELAPELCEASYSVSEGADNGTEILVANATDADAGAHGEVSFSLRNAQAGNPVIPFAVDPLTGSITVSVNPAELNELDRETDPQWLLQLQAYDGCEPNEAFCDIKVTTCILTVNVSDVNDNRPYLDPADVTVQAGEELLKGEEVPGSTITAKDDDLPNSDATEIHYLVTKFVNLFTGEEEELAFEAVDSNAPDGSGIMLWSCSLKTTKDLTHMAGSYSLTLQATDGTPESPGNETDLIIPIEITDANDYTPDIIMGACLVEKGQHVVISEELYTGGDCLPCYDGGPTMEMTYEDLDADEPNNLAVITVDYDNSTVYGGDGQLEFFYMKQNGRQWNLCLNSSMTANLSLEEAQAYNIILKVQDEGTPPLFSYDYIFLNLTPVSEFNPNFGQDISECYATTYILEETTDSGAFREAEDEDNAGHIYDTIYYYIVGGEKSKFFIPEPTVPEVAPYNKLDRDDAPGQYTILIRATNYEVQPPDVGGDVLLSTDMLQLTVVLIDQNDNPPVFNTSIVYGSVLQSGSTDQLAAILAASDKDLNETLDYQRVSDFTWDPEQNYGDDVFEVEDDGETGYVWLRRDPNSLSGNCLFTAMVNDRRTDDHQDTTLVQIFIVQSSDEVSFFFNNDIATLQAAQDDIEMVLTATFGYNAFVDSMSPSGGADNTTKDSVVEAHFVNGSLTPKVASTTAGNLVSPAIIESMASSALTSSQLQVAMDDIGLDLYQVGNVSVDDKDSLEAQLLTYQIVLGVVSIVLLSIVFLVSTAYCVRTRKLERRVKVLTTNTFGSQSSDLNKTGVSAAPNINLFKAEGANPIFNISLQEFNKQETGSISSGDSVLVGVEDNPEFRDYSADQTRNSKADAPAFVGTDGIASNNPLFSVQASAQARSIDGSDAGSQNDGDLGIPNSNFVFQ